MNSSRRLLAPERATTESSPLIRACAAVAAMAEPPPPICRSYLALVAAYRGRAAGLRVDSVGLAEQAAEDHDG